MSWKKKLLSINKVVILLCCCLLVFGCKDSTRDIKTSRVSTLPYYNEATFTPKWLDDSEAIKNFHKIPDFNLINQEGEAVTQNTFQNKIYITDFFFTSCPGICPKMTANMKVLQDAFLNDDDILLLSHSVTPLQDSVPILKNYAETKDVNNAKWHLVTGNRSDIYNLGRQAYFVEEDLGKIKTEEDFLHTENFVLIDKAKHIRGIYNGLNKTSVQQLIADVKTLQLEN